MNSRTFSVAMTFLIVCPIALAQAGDNARCHWFKRDRPPELLSDAEHCVTVDRTEPLTLESLRGQVVWLQFNFCEDCTPMRTQLKKWHEQFSAQRLTIIEINGGKYDSLQSMKHCVANKELEHFVLWDANNQNHKRYGIKAWPTAYLIGTDGEVIWQGNPVRALNRRRQRQMLLCQMEAELQFAQEDFRPVKSLLFVSDEKTTAADSTEDEHQLNINDIAPAFESLDDEGQKWKSSDHIGKKYVVVYFYPADFTLGCTQQAISFRDNANALAEENVEVVGISGDSVSNHRLFKKTWKLNFTLLADEEGAIAKQFGVTVGKGGRVTARDTERNLVTDDAGQPIRLTRKSTLARQTFIVSPEGKIVYKNTKVRPAEDSQQVLEFIRSIDAE